MNQFNLGDQVSVLQETIEGKVIAIDNEAVTIIDSDGFERQYTKNELAKITTTDYNFDDLEDVDFAEEKLRDLRGEKIQGNSNLSKSNYIDLHIEELVDDHKNLTNFEIVQVQMEHCKTFIRKALDSGRKKVYIIHGKGEGVLKAEVHSFLLKLRSENGIELEFHDAPYTMFGMGGATEVIFYR